MRINAVHENGYEALLDRLDFENLLVHLSASRFDKATLFGNDLDAGIVKELVKYILKAFTEVVSMNFYFGKISYSTVSPKEEEGYKSNALIIMPMALGLPKNQALPIVSYQHGTQLMRALAPSKFPFIVNQLAGEKNNLFQGRIRINNFMNKFGATIVDFLEVMLVTLFVAKEGYIVVMPDYQGLKEEKEDCAHPYVVASPLGHSVADLIVHTIKNELPKLKMKQWNGQVFLSGYSEGGYVTMAASKIIQEEYGKAFNITASAPAAGPYSLSHCMRLLMMREEEYSDGYYLPMTLVGYKECYGHTDDFNCENTLKPAFQELYTLVDGYHTPGEVSSKMKVNNGLIPKNVFSEEFAEKLYNNDKVVCGALKKNDLVNWKPEMPMKLYHSPNDDRVPYENSEIASSSFNEKGSNVSIVPVTGLPFIGIEHVAAFLPCITTTVAWFNTFVLDKGDTLNCDEALYPNHCLISKNKKYCLRFQLDGNLVIYSLDSGRVIWQWKVNSNNPVMCYLTSSGQLKLYCRLWNFFTYCYKESPKIPNGSGCKLVLQDDGNVVINGKGALPPVSN